MTERVVGIDPSLTGTGLASITAGTAQTGTIATKPAGGDVATRDTRMTYITDITISYSTDACLVVIEGPALAKHSPHTWDRAGLWWRIVTNLLDTGVPVAICPPTVRAKWATGKGGAGKAAVVAAIARMWPDIELTDDNAADALVFATMAAQRAELPTNVRTLTRHRDALDGVHWPAGW